MLKNLKPLIIACSSDDLESPPMERRLEDAGFDYSVSSPLSSKYVKDELIVMVEENIERINGIFNVHKMQ